MEKAKNKYQTMTDEQANWTPGNNMAALSSTGSTELSASARWPMASELIKGEDARSQTVAKATNQEKEREEKKDDVKAPHPNIKLGWLAAGAGAAGIFIFDDSILRGACAAVAVFGASQVFSNMK